MKRKNKAKITSGVKMRNTLLSLGMVGVLGAGVAYGVVSTKAATAAKLQNGSFEDVEGNPSSGNQIEQSRVKHWSTTSFDGKIEMVKENTNYIGNGILVKPTDGDYAVELNADEESTLYQNVTTTPSSIYEWGLDHGARNDMDTMALIIGPKQDVNPAKPSKSGRDQLMQMVDWLISQGKAQVKSTAGIDEQITVYSKKFGANGTFKDNAGNNAFSLTPSSIYTEEWHVWIMADGKATSSGTKNPWGHYGSNAEGSAGSGDGAGGTDVDLSKYYLYTVPAGQTETLFSFVSVGVRGTTNKTLGNFLDNINFQLYHPLSSSTTTHGSAIVGGSDGSSEAEGASKGHEVRVDGSLATYVTDGTPLKIQAIVKKDDKKSCDFVGVYYTGQDDKGEPQTEFLKKSNNVIDYSKDLTDEQKKGKWIKSENADGDTVYTYYLDDVTAAVDLHFVFIKSPTITYDSNGGKPYVVERTHNTGEASNVYSFKPVDGDDNSDLTFIAPYTSKAAEGQNDGWKFMGWMLTGDQVDKNASDTVNADKLGELLLPAEHTVACNYSINGATGEEASQYFNILNGKVSLTEKVEKAEDDTTSGAKWEGYTQDQRLYASLQKGLTMIAKWRWRQAFIPQTQLKGAASYEDNSTGGTVEITSVTDTNDENYTAEYGKNGGKAYHAETNEIVTAEAKAKDGFVFEGWYNANGKLLTTNTTYSYTETKESVNTFYARFSGGITQTYIRQIEKDGKWEDIEDDNIGVLGRYTYTDAAGMPVSSTATAANGYKFVGWYDANGNAVSSSSLINDGKTLSYKTTEDATYYARFAKTYNVKFVAQTKQKDGSFVNSETGGKVSTKSVTDIAGATASSKANANSGYKFLGWYDSNGNALDQNAAYSTSVTKSDGMTYYARFEITYNVTVENKAYLSFIAESENTSIPDVFSGRDAGTGKNTDEYGLDSKYGNTISTGFKYSLDNVTDVTTIQITVKVPDTAYVKTGGTSQFSGTGAALLSDSGSVSYNKGAIYKINGATTLTYYWDVSGLKAGTEYGVIIDNLYAPGATATITVNGTDGTKITDENGVVNTEAADYQSKSHYSK